MANGQDVFKGALGWDDWIWWVIIGGVALLILLLLLCCCVCMQRAKRKGHEEALAAVQAQQRVTQERELAEQRYNQAQQARYLPPHDSHTFNQGGNNGNGNGYAYSKPTPAVPLAPPPNRRNMGPQVAANNYSLNENQNANANAQPHGGYQPQQQQQQFAKQYPPLPAQQQQQPAYQAPPRWHNASIPQGNNGYESNAPRLSSHSARSAGSGHGQGGVPQAVPTASLYPDSMRYEDPYPTGGGPDGVPFISVTSPSASKSLKKNKAQGARLQPADKSAQAPPPVMVPRYQSAPPSPPSGAMERRRTPSPASRSPAATDSMAPSVAKASVGSTSTLQARIAALRSDENEDQMLHSRVSVDPRELSSTGTIQLPRTAASRESYGSGTERRTGLLAGSVLSAQSSAASSPRHDGLDTLNSASTFDPEMFESMGTTNGSVARTRADSDRSIGSDFSHGQFEDADSLAGSLHRPKGDKNANATTPGKRTRTRSGRDNESFNSRGSVEF